MGFSLEPTYSLETPNCLTEKNEVERVIRRQYAGVTNVRINITSTNSQGQKVGMVEVVDLYARKLLNSGGNGYESGPHQTNVVDAWIMRSYMQLEGTCQEGNIP